MREKLKVLKHHADVRTQFRQIRLRVTDVDAVHKNLALLEGFQGIDGFNERGLTRTRRSADHHDFAFFHGRRAVLENLK